MKDQSIKFKMTLGYIILGVTALFSIWYLLSEIKKTSSPREELLRENNTIFEVSNVVNNIYATESSGRIALTTTSNKDIKKYKNQLDSVKNEINDLKYLIREESTIKKLDTIQILISEKEKNFNEIIQLKKQYLNSDIYSKAFEKFRTEKKKFDTYANVNIEPIKAERKTLLQRIFNSKDEAEEVARLQKELDVREKIEQQHQNKRDSIALQAEQIFNEAIEKESKLQNEFLKKEELLMFKSRFLTQEIKLLLAEIEENVLANSTKKIQKSKEKLDETTTEIIYVVGFSLLLVLILGLIVIRDLNQSYQYKKELEILNKNLEKLMRQKSMFFATVTHDMVSPLNTLVGFTELLEKSGLNQTQKKYIKNIDYSTSYIRNLANDLVDFSKLEHNKIVLKKKVFHFGKLMESIFEPLSDSANQKDIDLHYEMDTELNDYFYSDPYRIKQILTNITTNAIKFTNKGEVKIKVSSFKNKFKISIKDTGIGIENKYQSDIFKEFKQAHGDIEKVYGGTGLGLNISKGLVELLGGTIEFSSTFGEGTEFIIYIPKVKKEHEIEFSNNLNFENNKVLINKNILIIDDDNLQLQLLTELLKDQVASISTLKDGDKLEEILNQNSFHLIISDIQMPNCNGYEVIKKIRKNILYEKTPVIAFTGKIDLDENDFLKLGFNSVIHKPIESNKLIFEIHRVLEINYDVGTNKKVKSIELDYINFNLNDIYLFCDSDLEAVLNIIKIFISETEMNISALQKATNDGNFTEITHIAHKMLPMFKQLHISVQVPKLLKLEREISNFDKETLFVFVQILIEEIQEIIQTMKKIKLI